MLDGILGRGFSAKCKPLIKLTKTRIDVLRRKRTATIRFLKKDLADLLANELDVNAYGRAGGLLDELRLLWNLDYVEKSCNFVYKHLSVMQKIGDCPEDCREAVSSLMFAAAGFSELPELRDLRQIFHERYGDSLELFVNQELAENLSSKPSSLEKKVKLLEDIASEFSVRWNSQGFEHRLSRHNAPIKDKHYNHGSQKPSVDKYKPMNRNGLIEPGDMHGFKPKERSEIGHVEQKTGSSHVEQKTNFEKEKLSERVDVVSKLKHYGSSDATNDKYKAVNVYEATVREEQVALSSKEGSEKISNGHRSRAKNKDANTSERHKSHLNSKDPFWTEIKHEKVERKDWISGKDHLDCSEKDFASTVPKPSSSSKGMESKPSSSSKGMESNVYGSNSQNSRENRENLILVREKRNDTLPFGKPDFTSEALQKSKEDVPTSYNRLPPPYVKSNGKPKNRKIDASDSTVLLEKEIGQRSETGVISNHLDNARSPLAPEIAKGYDHVSNPNRNHQDADGIETAVPERRSRRTRSKPSNHGDIGNPSDPDVMKRKSASRRRENTRKGLQILFDDKHGSDDEDERIMDKLLIHYSKKPSSYEEVKTRSKSKSKHKHHEPNKVAESVPPARSVSLPHEQKAPSETTKVFARAASFQPDRNQHVHPNLPDYDDLAARFAALKGR